MRSLRPLLFLVPLLQPLCGYSVLTHEALIDRCWDPDIKPLLLVRFPASTPDQLREAHGYAYGGAIIQDMGYYPFGSRFFSNLAHYTRSGDFVAALLRDAQDLDEYAFALGALAHYAADTQGHPVAVNRAVAIEYPKLAQKFGPIVTYEDDPVAHLKTEFSFDVIEVARGRYASEGYHDFIGFKVSKPLLERAFSDTYSLQMKELFQNLDLALGTYRFTVSQLLPELTATAWSSRKAEIQSLDAGMTKKKFIYQLKRTSYHKEWGTTYQKPGLGARFMACLLHVIPKVGPLKALGFKVPTLETEKLFVKSFNDTIDHYRALLAEVKQKRLVLANDNFDTGKPTKLGDYRMADETYTELLSQLAKSNGVVPQDLRANILAFYGKADAPGKVREELEKLRTASPQ